MIFYDCVAGFEAGRNPYSCFKRKCGQGDCVGGREVMNTGGLSGGEENSQSYYSDSSSIPSSFSDCEDIPIQELQFSGHQTSFSDELKLLLARDKGAAEDPVFENGNSVPLSHGAPVSQSGQFIGAIVEPGSESGSVPIISPGKEFHHLPLSPTSSSSAGHQTASVSKFAFSLYASGPLKKSYDMCQEHGRLILAFDTHVRIHI